MLSGGSLFLKVFTRKMSKLFTALLTSVYCLLGNNLETIKKSYFHEEVES